MMSLKWASLAWPRSSANLQTRRSQQPDETRFRSRVQFADEHTVDRSTHSARKHEFTNVREQRQVMGEHPMQSTSIPLVLISGCSPLAANAAEDVDATRNAFVATQDPLGESVTKVVYLNQNWSPDQSTRFYFTAQGSQIIPYDWFLALEQADSTTPFRDNQNILKYRYLPQKPGPLNPDGLPVGFVADPGVGRKLAGDDLRGVPYDGDPSRHHGVPDRWAPRTATFRGSYRPDLRDPADDERPGAIRRFAAKVLGTSNTADNQGELKAQMVVSIKTPGGVQPAQLPRLRPARRPRRRPPGTAGSTRSTRSSTRCTTTPSRSRGPPADGHAAGHAPVSYPCLWDTPQHDFVEWLGIAKNGGVLDIRTLSRNVGEVLGVFGDFSIPEEHRSRSGYPSSVRILNLTTWKTCSRLCGRRSGPPISRRSTRLRRPRERRSTRPTASRVTP